MPDRPLLVCDLDQTLIDANSFRLLLREVLRPRSVRALGVTDSLRLHRILGARALGRVDRVAMKQRTHVQLATLSAGGRRVLAERVGASMRGKLRPEVVAAVNGARNRGFTTVLATAGFEEHAQLIADALGFTHLLATVPPARATPWLELSGAAKRDAVCALADRIGARRPWVLLSDHADDEPLADQCDRVFWVARRTPLRTGCRNEVRFTPESFERWCRGAFPA